MAPSQTVVSGPAFTIGFFTIVIIILSVAGVLHGLFPEALKVSVTVPFAISFAPGIYVGVSKSSPTIVPSPVPFVQRMVVVY